MLLLSQGVKHKVRWKGRSREGTRDEIKHVSSLPPPLKNNNNNFKKIRTTCLNKEPEHLSLACTFIYLTLQSRPTAIYGMSPALSRVRLLQQCSTALTTTALSLSHLQPQFSALFANFLEQQSQTFFFVPPYFCYQNGLDCTWGKVHC